MTASAGPSAHRIGFVSTRFAGTDGVSLETAKWADVLEGLGHATFYFAGECDRPADRSRVVPEAHYRHPVIAAMNQVAYAGDWGTTEQARAAHPEIHAIRNDTFSMYIRPPSLSSDVAALQARLKAELYAFARDFDLELLIIENASTIPLNLPLGLAISEFIAETGFPTIAHHHDFHWERQRFLVNNVPDWLAAAFPPSHPAIRHVVLNSVQAQQVASRHGLTSQVIPNVMDFDRPTAPISDDAASVRRDLGVQPDELLILQPTRVIQRKGIEHAIEFVRRLGRPARLVISHAAGDEGLEYEARVREFAALLDVDVAFESSIIGERRGTTADGRRIYALGDVYPAADLVTYPSGIEGFGNGFLEAVYHRRPILVNNYSTYETDIKPKGFRVLWFDGFISEATLAHARYLLDHPDEAARWADLNYDLARRYFSYGVLRRRLEGLLAECFGEDS